jgi:hypothetical protein
MMQHVTRPIIRHAESVVGKHRQKRSAETNTWYFGPTTTESKKKGGKRRQRHEHHEQCADNQDCSNHIRLPELILSKRGRKKS